MATARAQQKEQTRLRLIKTATDLFTRQGIANTATAEIAKKLSVSHGTVFLHFPTREEFIAAVIDDFAIKLSDAFQAALPGGHTLRETLEAHIDTLAQYENFYFRLVAEMHVLPPQVRSQVFMVNSNVSWRMYEAAKPLIAKGEIRPIERHLMFNTWIAILQYYVLNRDLLSETTPILREKRRELVDHFLNLTRA